MEKLKEEIKKIVLQSEKIDWLIIHALGEKVSQTKNFEFSFIDKEERLDQPFKTNQGYLSLKNGAAIKSIVAFVKEFIPELKGNTLALSNFFIVLSRMSYKKDDNDLLIEELKKQLGNQRKTIFKSLISSLNGEYFKHRRSDIAVPKNTEDWLTLFRQSQYHHTISNPIMSVLELVRNVRGRNMNYAHIKDLNPLLRSFLLGWYGYEIQITKAEMKSLLHNETELIFLSACLIDDHQPDTISWLSRNLVKQFVEQHWDKIGSYMFSYVFGLNYRNKNESKLYKKLEKYLHPILLEKLQNDSAPNLAWIKQLSFPDSFIALFSWVALRNVKFSKISEANRQAVTEQFIAELQRIIKQFPESLISERHDDPLMAYRLNEPKYQNMLAYVLLFMIFASPESLVSIRKICFNVRPMFYGGYNATRLASDFTEVLMLIMLSGNRLTGIKDENFKNLEQLLKILEETLLLPYIHIAERQEEIWNPVTEKDHMTFNIGKYLINNALSQIKNHEVETRYQQLFQKIGEIKIAEWPYERMF